METKTKYSGEIIIPASVSVAPDLRACGGIMLGGVGGVFELLQDHRTGDAVAQFLGSADGTWHTVL